MTKSPTRWTKRRRTRKRPRGLRRRRESIPTPRRRRAQRDRPLRPRPRLRFKRTPTPHAGPHGLSPAVGQHAGELHVRDMPSDLQSEGPADANHYAQGRTRQPNTSTPAAPPHCSELHVAPDLRRRAGCEKRHAPRGMHVLAARRSAVCGGGVAAAVCFGSRGRKGSLFFFRFTQGDLKTNLPLKLPYKHKTSWWIPQTGLLKETKLSWPYTIYIYIYIYVCEHA